jgi:uncharacterized phage-associated protein
MMDMDKLHQIVLYFLHVAPRHKLGATKLWKLLYYVDLLHWTQFGHTVTELVYRKTRHGPLPGGAELLEAAVEQGCLTVAQVKRFNHQQTTYTGQTPPDMTNFRFSERAILAEVALHFAGATAGQLESAIRHSAPWKANRHGDVLGMTAEK